MSVKYKIRSQQSAYFLTLTVVEWIDVFSRKEYRDIFLESLKYCKEKKGLILHGYCIMTNHIHLIISSTGSQKLEDIVRDLKKFTSSEIVKAIESNIYESRRNWMLWIFKKAGEKNSNNKKYQFWIQDNHPIELYDSIITDQKLNYIHSQSGRSRNLYSSAKNYNCTILTFSGFFVTFVGSL